MGDDMLTVDETEFESEIDPELLAEEYPEMSPEELTEYLEVHLLGFQ